MLVFSTTNLVETMPSSTADNAIMTIGEVADYLKVTERTTAKQSTMHVNGLPSG